MNLKISPTQTVLSLASLLPNRPFIDTYTGTEEQQINADEELEEHSYPYNQRRQELQWEQGEEELGGQERGNFHREELYPSQQESKYAGQGGLIIIILVMDRVIQVRWIPTKSCCLVKST